jgi:hypothetical protein
MFLIQETVVESSVATTKFACDLRRCKGACCTMPGGRGAPLLDEEIDEIQAAFPIIKKYLNPDHLRAIEEQGLYEGEAGQRTTTCFNNRACVFVTYDGDVARCAFEMAYQQGEIGWRKPLSCHLFPLRVDRGNRTRVRYEHLPHCIPALERGDREGIPLVEFSRDALERAFGQHWYIELTDTVSASKTSPRVRQMVHHEHD